MFSAVPGIVDFTRDVVEYLQGAPPSDSWIPRATTNS
jgi:hypothetical protein